MKEIRISNKGTITLPKNLKARFGGSEALLIESDENVIILRKNQKLSLTEIASRLQAAGPKINKQDIEEAIKKYRQQKEPC